MRGESAGIRGYAIRAAAILVGLVVALVAVEIGLRALRLAPTGGAVTMNAAEFERLPGLFAPNQRVLILKKPDLPHVVTTDSLGYRGVSFPREKPDGEFRIVYAGDSGTWGDFVDDEEALPAQLEMKLQTTCGDVRVINAGVGGSSIRSQIHMVRRSLDVDPDLVLLGFNENDVDDLAKEAIWEQIARNREAKSRFPLSVVYPIVRRTALWNLALTAAARRRNRAAEARMKEAGNSGVLTRNIPQSTYSEETRRKAYKRGLAELTELLASRDIPLVVVLFPGHKTYRGKSTDELLQWVAGVAEELGVPTIDLLEPLQATGRQVEELYLLPIDGHTSPLGYRIGGEHLARQMAAHHMPAGRCLETAGSLRL